LAPLITFDFTSMPEVAICPSPTPSGMAAIVAWWIRPGSLSKTSLTDQAATHLSCSAIPMTPHWDCALLAEPAARSNQKHRRWQGGRKATSHLHSGGTYWWALSALAKA
jgi:hypothetical protein